MKFYQGLILIINFAAIVADWNLTWSDEFEKVLDFENWLVDRTTYSYEQVKRETFLIKNKSENFRVIDGHLVITPSDFKQDEENFYSSITTKRILPFGRIDIRASIPEIESVWVKFCLNTDPNNINERSICPINLSLRYLTADERLPKSSQKIYRDMKLSDFHVYTFEWNETDIVYKIDSTMTLSRKLNKLPTENVNLEEHSMMKLNIRHGVDRIMGYDIPKWPCTSLLIDYIRFYKFTEENATKQIKSYDDHNKVFYSRNDICDKISKWNLVWSNEFADKLNIFRWNTSRRNIKDDIPLKETISDLVFNYTNYARNLGVSRGYLITTVFQKNDYSYSAFINSENYFSYGKLEIRAAMPQGHSIWSVIYMESKEKDKIYLSLMRDDSMFHGIEYSNRTKNYTKINYLADFHVYTLEWDENNIICRTDGRTTFSHKMNEIEGKLFEKLSLNLKIGSIGSTNKTEDWSCSSMIIDYIRYYIISDFSLTPLESVKVPVENLCEIPKWQMVWSDEFNDGDTPKDLSFRDISGRDLDYSCFNERICFNRKNKQILDGMLIITAKLEGKPNEFSSSWVHSIRAFTFGKIVMRAAIPEGNGLITSIYLQHDPNKAQYIDPKRTIYLNSYTNLDELTRMKYGINTIYLRIPYNNESFLFNQNGVSPSPVKNIFDFNIYSIEWNETDIIFKINSIVILKYDLTQITYLYSLLSLSLKIDIDQLPLINVTKNYDWICPSLIIDYIRYYHFTSIKEFPLENDQEQFIPSRNNVCKKLNELRNPNLKLNNSNIKWIIPIILLIIIVIALITFLVIKLMKNELIKRDETIKMADMSDQNIYDEPDNFYASNEEVNNYLEIYEPINENENYVKVNVKQQAT